MTKFRLPMFNLSENYLSEVHRINDRRITSVVIQYNVMKLTENNEIFYLKSEFI